MKKYNHAEAIKNYISYEDLLQKLGYKQRKPRISNLGRALLDLSNHQRSNSFLKRYWDDYFTKLRENRKQKENKNKDVYKQNG